MPGIIHKIKIEITHAIPAIIFFIVSFNLINFTERLLIKSDIPTLTSYMTATIGALLVGKVLIIMNTFRFINAYPDKPLIFNICWKFVIYGIGILVVRVVEEVTYFIFHYHGELRLPGFLVMRLSSPRFWAIEVWLLMLFFVYVVATEFVRKIGSKKINQMLWGK